LQKLLKPFAKFLQSDYFVFLFFFYTFVKRKQITSKQHEKNYLILITAVNRACMLSRPVSEEKHQSGYTGRTLHQRSGTNGIYLAL
jgi:hypothetical protein